MNSISDLIEKAKAEAKASDLYCHDQKMEATTKRFAEQFRITPDKVEWVDDLGVVITSGDVRLAFRGEDNWSLTAICEECGKEFADRFGTNSLAHMNHPSIHEGCPKAPRLQTCPIMSPGVTAEQCMQGKCALWNATGQGCSITILATVAVATNNIRFQ
jgi:hypothetical protein